MNWKAFTPEELAELQQNPYVKAVTAKTIRFTVDFKQKFWNQYQLGQSPDSILQSMGFHPNVLGPSRINGIVQHLKDAARSGEGFRDTRRSNLDDAHIEGMPPSKALIRMQHELCYLKQEMDFLKKIIAEGRRAR